MKRNLMRRIYIYQNKYITIEYFENNEHLSKSYTVSINDATDNLKLFKFFFENENCQPISKESFNSLTHLDELFQKHKEIHNLSSQNVTA